MAKDSRDQQLIELKDNVKELNTTIKNLNAVIEVLNKREEEHLLKEQEHLEREKVLQEQIDYLTKKLFGKSSEKRDDFEGQMSLFNEAETLKTEPDPEEQEFITVEKHSRKKKSKMADKFANVPVQKKYIDVPEEDRVCGKCGTALERIGEEYVRREIEIIKPSIKIIEYYSITYGCPKCKEDAEKPFIVKGRDVKPHLLHGMASAGMVAWVMYQKYVNALPLYRQERDFKLLYNVDICRGTIANWIINNAEDFLSPLCNYFRRKLVSSRYAMADETPVQVLKEKGRRPESKSYMWVFRTGEYDKQQIVLFHYSETRAGDTAKEFLEGFHGYLMTDGYSGYNKLKDCTRTSCWAHVRRYLVDAIPKGKEYDHTQPAVQGLVYIDKLFDMEKKIHGKTGVTFDAIKEYRLEKEVPVLDGFWEWLDVQKPIRGSRMEKAVTYIRNRKQFLLTYLEDGGTSFHNNTSERSCKAFVTGRKNWMFSDTPNGANASAYVYSIVETAKANNVDIYHYLKYLMLETPTNLTTDDKLERLCPWNPECKEAIEKLYAERQKEIFDAM
ncbi:IS66 family transposase [Butyrivibrio sp. AE2032]|uniref:IS66 family transposase n=1 Tax=Butyrivibrio sp. AE2032 TaxID=1458463 RepID=UPI00068FC3DD|nr:IS66 family transposase [Butyrivibrio sp. AE2032]